MVTKVTFKRGERGGVGYPYPSVDIKIKKKVCGHISPPTWETKGNIWKLRFSVKKLEPDDNPNCDWMWITLINDFDSEELAREAVPNAIDFITKIYDLHFFEE